MTSTKPKSPKRPNAKRANEVDPTAHSANGDDDFNFTRYLDAIVDSKTSSLKKGERSRMRLLVATSRLLEKYGFHDLQMHLVGQEAGMSASAVYRYFDNKESLTMELMKEFTCRVVKLLLQVRGQDVESSYRRVYQVNLLWVKLYAANVGLMACAEQLFNSNAIPEFIDFHVEKNAEWQEAIASSIMRNTVESRPEFRHALVAASNVAVMVDGILHQTYVLKSGAYRFLKDSPEELAEMITFFWFRTVYGQEPDTGDVSPDYPYRRLRESAAEQSSTNVGRPSC